MKNLAASPSASIPSGRRRITAARLGGLLSKVVLFVLLLGFAYVILYPFLAKFSASLMPKADLYDPTVALIPRHPGLDNYKDILASGEFFPALWTTFYFALVLAVCATFCAAVVGYGLARYRFRGSRLLFVLVVCTLLVPSQTISIPLFSYFKFFDIFGLLQAMNGQPGITNSVWPLVLLGITGLSFRGGIFIILMRQYYKNIPTELVEAAYVDGAGHLRTFGRIILPMARSMLVVVFILAFAWQWTDTFYTNTLMGGTKLLPNVVLSLANSNISASHDYYYNLVQANTALLLAVLPLLILYVLFQRQIIAGIERSGLVE